MKFYLTQYELEKQYHDGLSCHPVGTQPGMACIDLRADGGASLEGNGLNAGLAVYREDVQDYRARKLAEDLDEPLGQLTRAFLRSKFQLAEVPPCTLREFTKTLFHQTPAHLPYRIPAEAVGYREICLGPAGIIWSNGERYTRPIHKRQLVADTFRRQPSSRMRLLKWFGVAAVWGTLVSVFGYDAAWTILFGTQLESDPFTRADNTTLNDASHAWAIYKGASDTLGIFSNQVDVSVINTRNAMGNAQVTWPNDQYAQAKIVLVSSQETYVTLRGETASGTTRNWYAAGDAIGNRGDHITSLRKYLANVESEIANSGSVDISAGVTVYAEVTGSSPVTVGPVKVNEVQKIAGTTDASSPLTAGKPGLHTFHTTGDVAIFDDFVGGDFVVAPTSPPMFRGS